MTEIVVLGGGYTGVWAARTVSRAIRAGLLEAGARDLITAPALATPAVARAAMEAGVATRPIEDLDSYRDRLSSWVFRTGLHGGAREVQWWLHGLFA